MLRQAEAHLDPRLVALRARLVADDVGAWLGRVCAGQATNPEEELLVAALHAADRVARGEPDALSPAAAALFVEVWAAVAERAPLAFATVAERALDAFAAQSDSAPRTEPTGSPTARRVGRYELIDSLGAGASGAVFRARHADNGMVVAVKLLRLEALSPEHVERFRREAKITARLDHPAIVRLIDSGVDEGGGLAVPYLVSELVQGQPFAEALRGCALPVVLATFAQVCEAVAHAHARGVLHRDLKSANVLVDAGLRPHVLDFGIARLLHGDVDATRTGQVLGTPSAMSPEQAAGNRIDVRSDVWSLGALLFEALTGVVPHDLAGTQGAAVLRRIAEGRVRRVAQVRPDLPGDVAAVVDKALAADLGQRYQSTIDLVFDVRRLLAGDPVSARPPTIWQSLARVARRHRLAALTATLATLIILGAGLAILLSRQRALAAEGRALAAKTDAEKDKAAALDANAMVLAFADVLVETATPTGEQRQLLETALDRLVRRTRDDEPNPEPGRVESRLREFLADILVRIEDIPSARVHLQRVVDLRERLADLGHDRPVERARALVKLGDLDKTTAPAQTRRRYEAAHEIFTAAARAPQAPLAERDDWGWSLERLAELARHDRRVSDALELSAQRLAVAEALVAEQPDGLRQYGLGNALAVRALCVTEGATDVVAANATARALRERACEAARAALAAQPGRRAFLQFACTVHMHLGNMQLRAGDTELASKTLATSRYHLDELVLRDPASVVIRRLAMDIHELAACCAEQRGDTVLADSNRQLAFEHATAADLLTRRVAVGDAAAIDVAERARRATRVRAEPAATDLWSTRYAALLEAAIARGNASRAHLAALALWLVAEVPTDLRDPDRGRALALQAVATATGEDTPEARERVVAALRQCGMEREAAEFRTRWLPPPGGK